MLHTCLLFQDVESSQHQSIGLSFAISTVNRKDLLSLKIYDTEQVIRCCVPDLRGKACFVVEGTNFSMIIF